MTSNHVRKVHMNRNGAALCGAHLNEKALINEEPDEVTCKNCLNVMRAEIENKQKYPFLHVDKKGITLFISEIESRHTEVSLSEDGIFKIFKDFEPIRKQ